MPADWQQAYRGMAEAALRSTGIPLDQLAALASGEAWIAPMEPTKAMLDKVVHYASDMGREQVTQRWRAMRDRYLTPDEPESS